jgi:hypothetical protein
MVNITSLTVSTELFGNAKSERYYGSITNDKFMSQVTGIVAEYLLRQK